MRPFLKEAINASTIKELLALNKLAIQAFKEKEICSAEMLSVQTVVTLCIEKLENNL